MPSTIADVDVIGRLQALLGDALSSAKMGSASFGFPNDRIQIQSVHGGGDEDTGREGEILHPTDYVKALTAVYRQSWVIKPLEEALALLEKLASQPPAPLPPAEPLPPSMQQQAAEYMGNRELISETLCAALSTLKHAEKGEWEYALPARHRIEDALEMLAPRSHPDDVAIWMFSQAMRKALQGSRKEWQLKWAHHDHVQQHRQQQQLSDGLRARLAEGDLVGAAVFAMYLTMRHEAVLPSRQAALCGEAAARAETILRDWAQELRSSYCVDGQPDFAGEEDAAQQYAELIYVADSLRHVFGPAGAGVERGDGK